MRFKYLLLGFMLLILAGSMTAISAADTDEIGILDEKIFTIPEDFEIMNQSGEYAYLENSDGNQSIVIMVRSTDPNKILSLYEQVGYEFNDTYRTYQRGIYKVSEIGFTYEDYIGLLFACENGNDRVYILHSFLNEDDFPTDEDMLALKLISSLQDNLWFFY